MDAIPPLASAITDEATNWDERDREIGATVVDVFLAIAASVSGRKSADALPIRVVFSSRELHLLADWLRRLDNLVERQGPGAAGILLDQLTGTARKLVEKEQR